MTDADFVELRGPVIDFCCYVDVLLGSGAAESEDGSVDPDRLLHVRGIIDTGATFGCVGIDLAERLGLESGGRMLASLAHGEAEIDYSEALLGIQIGGGAIWRTGKVGMTRGAHDLLIGMRDIALGVFTVDQSRGEWAWRVRRSRVRAAVTGPVARFVSSNERIGEHSEAFSRWEQLRGSGARDAGPISAEDVRRGWADQHGNQSSE